MSEYITRERALEILNDIGGCGAEPGSYTAGWDEAINAAYEAIQDEPAADVAPVVHATGKATIRMNHTAPIVGFLTNMRKVKTPRQQITAATVGQKWTKMRLKTLNAARVGTGITVQKSKKTKMANGLYAAICATELYGAIP